MQYIQRQEILDKKNLKEKDEKKSKNISESKTCMYSHLSFSCNLLTYQAHKITLYHLLTCKNDSLNEMSKFSCLFTRMMSKNCLQKIQ